MPGIDDLKDRLTLPPISQIGVVVKDVEKTAAFYSSAFGIGPFTVYEWSPDRHWNDEKPSYLRLRMAKVMWDNVELELIEPLEGTSDHRSFLETHGEGLHHLGFNVANYEGVFEKFLSEGFRPLMRAESYVEAYKGHLKACSFDTRKVGGVLFEIIWKSWLMGS
jgi:catechol 2,3-dioxygenase-like lactoylglutathione lyase family enzyme